MQSLADIGGMDDLTGITNIAAAYQRQSQNYDALLPVITAAAAPHVFLSLRAPYDISRYGQYADVVLASYAYNAADNPSAIGAGNATYEALAQALLQQFMPKGRLPVTSSYRTTPSDQTSARSSTFLPRICSGAMYFGDPIT